jgi:signal transduction histidine kinase/ActR/RegA family two-component response regulator
MRMAEHPDEILAALYKLVDDVSRAASAEAIHAAALEALATTVGPDRAAVLVCDDAGVMRFRAWRGLSETYRRAVEGHSPWAAGTSDPEPVIVPDARADASLADYRSLLEKEGLGALAFIPLVSASRLLGKFMLYYDAPHAFAAEEIRLAWTIAHHVAFGLERLAREQETARLKDELMRLHAISQRFLERGNLSELLSDILAAAIEITGARRGTMQLLEPATGRLRLVAHHGFAREFLDFFAEVSPGEPASCAHALEAGRRVVVTDLDHDPIFAEPTARGVMQRAGVRACQSTPLLSRTRRVLGMVSTHFDVPHQASARELQLMDLFARQAADLVEHAQAADRRNDLLAAEAVARTAAEAANQAKDEFIAMVSHELRTPLTAMLGWTRMLRSGQLDARATGHGLEVIERNLRQQTQILTDLLDVSRIVSGKLTLDLQVVELAPVIEMALDVVRPAAEAKRQVITTHLEPFAASVSGDATRLQQVFWNVISNAVKFTPPEGRIDIRLVTTDSHARIAVADTGRGIAPAFLPYLFQRFQQAETGFTRQHGGLGLGLAIVHHLVELHGGRVEASSPGEGQGATFVVELPLAPATSLPAAPAEPALGRDRRPALDKLRLLVVDDHEDTVEFLAAALGDYGAEVKIATSAPEALGVLREHRPHVIVSDLSMPGEDGFQLIKRIRAERSRVAAIALTAHARSQDRERALAAGFQMYLAKPIEPARLGHVIEALVNGGSEPQGD